MASNYYEILGVSTSASTSNIRAAYRQHVKEYHPDTSDYIDSVTIFKQLKAGYDVLSNRERRSKYDQLGHDAFVEKHGGYTQSEIRDATETQIQIHSNAQGDATDDWQESQQYRLREQRTAAESGSIFRRLFNLVIQGRTPTSDGTVAFAIRIGIYAVLVSLIAFPVAVLVGGYDVIARSFMLSATVLIISRVIYLSGFEYLRGEYIKIDTKPEPDAYTIPYALGLAGVALGVLATLGALILGIQSGISTGVTSVLVVVSLLFMYVAFPISLMWTILSVGFGVADDRYNLQYDVHPVWWNFTVQAPVLLTFAAFGHLSAHYLVAICCLSFVVAAVYLLRSHREIWSELRWRISNGRVFASQ